MHYTLHFLADWNGSFVEKHTNFSRLCDFDERAHHTAACPITQNMDDRS